METLLILIASVVMLVGPTLLVRDDPNDDGLLPSAWRQRALDLYCH